MAIIKTVLVGGCGQMGKQLVKTFAEEKSIELVGVIDKNHIGEDAGAIAGISRTGIKISSDLKKVINDTEPDIMVEFTHHEAACNNINTAISCGISSVVGSTGFSEEELEDFHSKAGEKGVRVFIAPNFSIGAVLMMKFAAMAAPYFSSAEIIELHHNRKKDAPSGTARATARKMLEKFTPEAPPVEEKEILPGARGGEEKGIRIHSVRLPGLIAHQEVLFGGNGEVFKIRHDGMGRECFMPGTMIAVKKLDTLPPGLTFGLDKLLDF